MEKIKVAVTGACGKMGAEVVRTIAERQDMQLVMAVDKTNIGEDIGLLACHKDLGVKVEERLTSDRLKETGAKVLVDFTIATAALNHSIIAIKNGVIPIIGTSGIGKQEQKELIDICKEKDGTAYYIPNFSIGAVLMMKFAEEAGKILPNCEIVELHHDNKIDAPSGTAIRTAELIAQSRTQNPRSYHKEVVKVEGARGGEHQQIKIHSIRLPGLVAHQEVIFGGVNEILTIRHDSLDRKSFMSGVAIAILKANQHKGLVIGLEHLL